MSPARSMTVAQARDQLRAVGWVIRNTGWGDFRCGPAGCSDEQAHYTTDLADAVATARAETVIGCTLAGGHLCSDCCGCARLTSTGR